MFNLYQQRATALDRTFKDKFVADTERYNYLSGMADSTSLDFKKSDGSFNWNAVWNWGGLAADTINTVGNLVGTIIGLGSL